MKKALLFVLPHLRQGGAEASTVQMLPELCKTYDVSMVLLKDGGALLPTSLKGFSTYVPGRSISSRLKPFCHVLSQHWDVVISRVWFANFICLLLASRPVIIYEDAVPSELAKQVMFGQIKLWIIQKLYKRAYRIVCVSPVVAEDLHRLGIPKTLTRIIPNPIYHKPHPSHTETTTEKIVLAYVGSLRPYKGWDILTEAINQLSPEISRRITLRIIGNQMDLTETFTEFVSRGGTLVTHGILPPEQIPYEDFDAVIIPSRVQESFCNVFHEGLASGCFVLCTQKATPYLPAQLEGVAMRTFKPTADALACAITELVRNECILINRHANAEHPLLAPCRPTASLGSLRALIGEV